MDGSGRKGRSPRWVLGLVAVLFLIGTVLTASAATDKAGAIGTYQVVAGNDDKAYLVDTVTGAVWVLTYRTMATGREPIAIPYKFIRIAPTNQGEFLVESAGEGASMPPSGSR